jgi:hypothetical protein
MLRTRWRTWLGWTVGCAMLIGVGVALYATLPPQPRFVLRGSHTIASLSPDGKILTTHTRAHADDLRFSVSLKAWDTLTGQERGEFFRGLIGSRAGGFVGDGMRALDFIDEGGFSTGSLLFSPDRRYCALTHQGGLALADLHSGQEWPAVVKTKIIEYLGPESIAVYRLLQQLIDTKALQEKVPFKKALEYFSDRFAGKLPYVVDRDAFADELGADAPDPYEEEVCLPPVPSKMIMNTALRLVLAQIGKGRATYVVRRNFIEITTRKRARELEVWPPIFSPRGSFVALAEGDIVECRLHIVECATGHTIATLPLHPEAPDRFGFTPDDELLYFHANEKSQPLLTVWDTRKRCVARTIKDAAVGSPAQFAPDGRVILGTTGLIDLGTGQSRPVPELSYYEFSPDGRTLLGKAGDELRHWDVASGKMRHEIKIHWLQSPLVISADSQVVVCAAIDKSQSFTAWSIETGARLWPPPEPKCVDLAQNRNGAVVQEVFEGGGLMSRAEMSPRFTPDRRFLIERKQNRIITMDPSTGNVHASLVMARDAKDPAVLGFTPDGRWMVSQWDYPERQPWFGEEWLAKWLPIRKTVGCILVSETETGRVQLQINRREADPPTAVLSDDGSTLMTCMWQGDSIEVACWDVPGRPSLLLVVGVPFALGCIALLVRWRWTRKRATPQPAIPV